MARHIGREVRWKAKGGEPNTNKRPFGRGEDEAPRGSGKGPDFYGTAHTRKPSETSCLGITSQNNHNAICSVVKHGRMHYGTRPQMIMSWQQNRLRMPVPSGDCRAKYRTQGSGKVAVPDETADVELELSSLRKKALHCPIPSRRLNFRLRIKGQYS